MAHRGLKFGIFMGPFHPLGENPTLALQRDLELIQWLDHLGFDEAWVGEHHSAGWEIIAAPDIFIATAAERTRHIRLGSGVTSLPYHHPLHVAQRFVLLDHLTRGRIMLGVGPGALLSDAYMMGIDAADQRRRMMESLDAITRLLRCDGPVTMKTDWFELREAQLHLAPYSDPCFEIAVANSITPFGMVAAGRHGLGILMLGASIPGGPEKIPEQWRIAEEEAARHGRTMERAKLRLVVNLHLAEDDEQAVREVEAGFERETHEYFEATLSRPPGPVGMKLGDAVKRGTVLIGTPETVIKGMQRLIGLTQGGCGGFVIRAQEWATREQTLRSYELFARYVMPHFQGSLDQLAASNEFVRSSHQRVMGGNVEAVRKAFEDSGRAVPDGVLDRIYGAKLPKTD